MQNDHVCVPETSFPCLPESLTHTVKASAREARVGIFSTEAFLGLVTSFSPREAKVPLGYEEHSSLVCLVNTKAAGQASKAVLERVLRRRETQKANTRCSRTVSGK